MHQADWYDDGMACGINEYWRGEGYISRSICEHHQGTGNCDKWGLLFYPKCSEGFYSIGCCVCVIHIYQIVPN
jgi:hypothetical protein